MRGWVEPSDKGRGGRWGSERGAISLPQPPNYLNQKQPNSTNQTHLLLSPRPPVPLSLGAPPLVKP